MDIKFFQKQDLSGSLALVVGTRPGIIMFSPIIRACIEHELNFFIIHTGQHYSPNMDRTIFENLKLPKPKHHIEGVADKKLHGSQTAAMLEGIEKVLVTERPSVLLVGGDANTNLAGALAARKLHITLGHVEAGERSFDWRMPEEHNRRIIDHISDLLFTTNEKGAKHLADENVMGKTFVTGNTIVDAAYQNHAIAEKASGFLSNHNLKKGHYAVLTSHREENVDDRNNLTGILTGAYEVAKATGLTIFFAAHPRTLNRLENFGLLTWAKSLEGVVINEAPAYLDFLTLIGGAKMILTDSGGVQQEACILKKPCVTLRENSEWTETLDIGANVLAGADPKRILAAALSMKDGAGEWDNPFGDGKAAERIVGICSGCLA